MRPEQYEVDLELLREMGVNAIRSHFPFPHDFLAACDRAGIMVWIEPPVYCIDPKLDACRHAFTDPAWRALALKMIEEMVEQSRLHPSVCLYGIGNECQVEAPGAMDFFRTKEIDGHWNELNYKGVVSYWRRKKLPFFVLKEAYARRRARKPAPIHAGESQT
jgi:beta-galactosidase/beta-glucuronidase